MSTGQLARDVIRAEKLPICEVCGDRREPKGSAFAAHVKGIHHRARDVLTLIPEGVEVSCLGRTKGDAPKHPLYLRADTARVPFGGSRG